MDTKILLMGAVIIAIALVIILIQQPVKLGPTPYDVKNNPNIGDIISNPRAYEGKELILTGKYGGWGHCEGARTGVTKCPKDLSKSAIVIFDDTGCIYIGGGEWLSDRPMSDPQNPMNETITIRGTISLDDEGTPYISDAETPLTSYKPSDVWENRESMEGKTFIIEEIVEMTEMGCTEMGCSPEDPCCNSCSGQLGFQINMHRDLNFEGAYNGKNVGCTGDDCDMECHPLEAGKEYRMTVMLKTHETNVGVLYYLELLSFEQ